MKLLIIGCGSIGSRHARNAQALGHSVALCDPIPERGQYTDYKAALQRENVDAAVVASPSNLHVEAARYLAEKGVPIFMEKPLATSRDGLAELVQTVKKKKLITMMAQSYRWHEGLLALKKLLEDGTFGSPQHVVCVAKEYLPDWHPDQDYRREYAAQKKMGGGAMFTSMSHTLDTLEWLFGDIVEIEGSKERSGNLDMDVDDTVDVKGQTARGVSFNAHNDYFTKQPVNTIRVECERGVIELDLRGNKLNGEPYAFDPNKRYMDELAYFIQLVERGESDPAIDIAHGAHIVELMTDSRIRDLTV